jgi:SAM-dependent methyltransferase
MSRLRKWLAHPLTAGLDIDSPETTALRRRIIQENRFLRQIYQTWYGKIAAALPQAPGTVLELGAGAGFLHEFVPDVITSELFPTPGVNAALDGQCLPFRDGSLRAIALTNVLHHLPQPRRFFAEAGRCVRPGGALLLIEPWVTAWSGLIYTQLHHEPFAPDMREWEFPSSGPLSGANGALPWIIFERDRAQFEREFPMWRVEQVEPMMAFAYLVSGGVSMRQLMPGWSFPLWRMVEQLPGIRNMGMFAWAVVRRTE